jgi:hypothetical protein
MFCCEGDGWCGVVWCGVVFLIGGVVDG